MVLKELRDDGMWINSTWELTYKTGWMHITRAVEAVFDFYDGVELLVNGKPVAIESKSDICSVPEGMNLTVRGSSGLIRVPVSITFHNQLRKVSVSVCKLRKEFEAVDYESFNKSLGCYLNSIELAMYRQVS